MPLFIAKIGEKKREVNAEREKLKRGYPIKIGE
jgi:hypothetical protein